jgi:cell division septal protein FtsQ
MGVLVVFLISDVFTVRGVAVSGLTTMPREEIIRLTDVLGTNVFLLQPTAVRARLLADPAIADANVQVVLGSINVLLDVQEREPALIWERAGLQSWVDIHGYVTLPRSERPELLRIVDDSLNPQPPLQLSTDVVQGALQLQTLLPEQNQLRYSEGFGLGYTDPRGWQVWLGVGTDMPNRMLIYNAIVTNLQARGIVPSLIDVSDPQAVYYAVGL